MRAILTDAFNILMGAMALFCFITLARFMWVTRESFLSLWR